MKNPGCPPENSDRKMNEFVTVSESKTATAHEIFNNNTNPVTNCIIDFSDSAGVKEQQNILTVTIPTPGAHMYTITYDAFIRKPETPGTVEYKNDAQ